MARVDFNEMVIANAAAEILQKINTMPLSEELKIAALRTAADTITNAIQAHSMRAMLVNIVSGK